MLKKDAVVILFDKNCEVKWSRDNNASQKSLNTVLLYTWHMSVLTKKSDEQLEVGFSTRNRLGFSDIVNPGERDALTHSKGSTLLYSTEYS